MKTISIIVPCYNEEAGILSFFEEIKSVFKTDLADYKLELIFINDGSTDKTHERILMISTQKEIVKYIDFARNFGKEAAMLAGLESCTGDYITVIDADLQDPPHLLKEMVQLLEDNECDIVLTRRKDRKNEPLIRSFFSNFFYSLMKKASSVDMPQGVRDYRLMTRQVVDSILSLKEYHRFSKGLFSWPGFKSKTLEFNNIERIDGKSSWSFLGLCSYAFEGIIAFTVFPLRVATFMGIILFILSLFIAWLIFLRKIIYGDPVQGWTSTVILIIFFCSLQLIFLGVIGEYLSKIYEQIKGRPHYIIRKKYNYDK